VAHLVLVIIVIGPELVRVIQVRVDGVLIVLLALDVVVGPVKLGWAIGVSALFGDAATLGGLLQRQHQAATLDLLGSLGDQGMDVLVNLSTVHGGRVVRVGASFDRITGPIVLRRRETVRRARTGNLLHALLNRGGNPLPILLLLVLRVHVLLLVLGVHVLLLLLRVHVLLMLLGVHVLLLLLLLLLGIHVLRHLARTLTLLRLGLAGSIELLLRNHAAVDGIDRCRSTVAELALEGQGSTLGSGGTGPISRVIARVDVPLHPRFLLNGGLSLAAEARVCLHGHGIRMVGSRQKRAGE
jgi:hypothetical protein